MQSVQYIRVSSDEQSKGGSMGAQTREGSEFIERKGFEQVGLYADVETAKSAGREQFNQMVAFLKRQKQPVAIVVEKTDRLYRNYDDMVLIKGLVKSKGHEVHLYKENEVLNRETSSHSWLIHYFKVGMATNYVENLSEEIKKGRKEKLLNGGYPHRAPYGYSNDKNTRSILINPSTAPFVREAYKLFSSGIYSLEKVSGELYDSGLIYRPSKPTINKGALAKLLKNPFYKGDMAVDGKIYPGKHEPLVSVDTWEAAQEAFKRDGKALKRTKRTFKYANLLRCDECGYAFVGEEKKGGRYTYYRCGAMKKGCSQGYISEGKLDKHFDRFIESLILDPAIEADILQCAQELVDDDSAAVEMTKTQAEISRYKTRLKAALQEKIDGNIDSELFQSISSDYQNTIKKLEARLSEISTSDINFFEVAGVLVDLPRTVAALWFEAKTEGKIKLLNFASSNFFIKGEKMRYELKEPLSLIGKTALREAWWRKVDVARTRLSSLYCNGTLQKLPISA